MTTGPFAIGLSIRMRLFMSLALAGGLIAAAAAEPVVSRLRMRARVVAAQEPVALGDVLAFGEADVGLVAKIADAPVFTDVRDASRATITHDDVVRRLTELEVNPALVLVEGASVCRVITDRAPAPPTANPPREGAGADGNRLREAGDQTAAASAVVDPPTASVRSQDDGGATLADRIRELINRDMAALGGTAEVEFERAGREFLDLTSPLEFEIRAADREKLGVREFRVAVKRDGKALRTASVAARVRLIRNAVVAARPLSIGNLVRDGDIRLEPQVFDSVAALGLDSHEQALGRQVTKFVPAGEMLRADGLKAVDLVQRSKPITVLNGAGGVQMRLAGIALDAGAYGDSVRVRLGEGRSARQQVQAVVVGVNTVRLSEVQP